jgi:predicted TIM-barrel fold metal-dependent hydrolase
MKITRRDVLAGFATAGASAFLPRNRLFAQAPGGPRRLDLHHHFATPRWIKRVAEIKRQGWETFQPYKPADAIEAMDKGGVATAFLSLTTPGIWYGDDFVIERAEAVSMARDMNEYAARMMSDYKGRFGLFAVLPLPDIDASLREIEYAFDTLRADGVGLLTSYGRLWPGDRQLGAVFDELDRRKAVVYSHPTDAACCHSLLPNTGPGTIEWNTDTSRAIYSIVADNIQGQGTPSAASRYPNITFIWSHGGGTLLGLVGRFNLGNPDQLANPPQSSRLAQLRRFYYDTAGSANPVTMQALKMLVGASQIVYGTDYPFGGTMGPANIADGLKRSGFTAEELRAIDRDNALRILPKYRAA